MQVQQDVVSFNTEREPIVALTLVKDTKVLTLQNIAMSHVVLIY